MNWDRKEPVRLTIYEPDGTEYGQRWRFMMRGDVRGAMKRLHEETGRRIVARDYESGKFLGEYPTKKGWAKKTKGNAKDDGPRDRVLNVRVNDEIYRWVKGKGNISAYLVGLIIADKETPPDEGGEGEDESL